MLSGSDAFLTWLDSLYLLGDTSSVFLECSTSIHPIRQKRVKQRERGEEVIEVEMVAAAHHNSTIFVPRLAVAEPSFPVYTSKSLMKPLELLALTHTLKPLLMGFMGRYCFSEDQPLYLTIASSMAHSRWGEYASRKECRTASIAGRTFPRRSYPSSPRIGRESCPGDARSHRKTMQYLAG